VLGSFLEISISTRDIRASVDFYEALGFSQCQTGDVWPHPYGVLSDGHVYLGLHQYVFPSPSLTFVRPEIARHVDEFRRLGIELAFAKLADDQFNEIGFRDPTGQMITILEARTCSPTDRKAVETSLCGYFAEFSLPSADFDATKLFWEKIGFVALDETEHPYASLPLTRDGLSIALHRPRFVDQPLLVFRDATAPERIEALRAKGVQLMSDLPRGLDPAANALIESPEGTLLLLVRED
jgi:catechol 2,3-dioxygenase-like lactoylglutathione lyase family enzyme